MLLIHLNPACVHFSTLLTTCAPALRISRRAARRVVANPTVSPSRLRVPRFARLRVAGVWPYWPTAPVVRCRKQIPGTFPSTCSHSPGLPGARTVMRRRDSLWVASLWKVYYCRGSRLLRKARAVLENSSRIDLPRLPSSASPNRHNDAFGGVGSPSRMERVTPAST